MTGWLAARLADGAFRLDCRVAARRPVRSGVLLVAAGGLGDLVLLAHVAHRFAALAHEGEPLTLMIRKDAAHTAFVLPPAIAVETVDFGRLGRSFAYRLATLRRVFRAGYRLAVSLDFLRHPDLDEAIVLAASADGTLAMEARRWPKHDRALTRNRARFTRLYPSGDTLRDKLDRWSDFADRLTGTAEPAGPCVLPADRRPAPLDGPPTVVVQPFSAVAGKQLLPDTLAAVFDAVPPRYRIVVTGGPQDAVRNPQYGDLLLGPRVSLDLRPFTNIAPLLASAALVISVDTALLHLAIALGAPTLGLLSAAYVGEIVPYRPERTPAHVRFLYHDMPCRSCLGDCRLPAEQGVFPCVARLDADDVGSAVRQLLQRDQVAEVVR
ncbi:MAG: lipopolysaccharide heptosyltransferase family protein [Proteobacteria bacterium]|nr:lipopolysaccharide heptosyltransferase family protein [Pseudomonadota bacterium]